MADRISKWTSIKKSLERLRDEIGYIALASYYADRKGEQVGRVDMTDRMMRHWLALGPDDEDDEEGLARTLAQLSQSVPAPYPDDNFNLTPEPDPLESAVDDAFDAIEAPEMPADSEDANDGPQYDADGMLIEHTEEEEDSEEAPSDASLALADAAPPVPVEPQRLPLTPEDCEAAIRRWMLATCENNTEAGATQRFRVRFYGPKGKQIWSTLFSYESASAAPTPTPGALASVEGLPTVSASGLDAPLPMTDPGTGLPQMPYDPQAAIDPKLTELFNMNEAPPNGNGVPPVGHEAGFAIPTSGDVAYNARKTAVQASMGEGALTPDDLKSMSEDEMRGLLLTMMSTRGNGGAGGPSVYEIETLLHLHGLYRGYGALMFNSFKGLTGLYENVLGQLAGALADSREHNDELLGTMQQFRLSEIEQAVEFSEAADKSNVRAVLGREAIQQGGLIGRLLIQNAARRNGLDSPSPEPQDEAPAEGPNLQTDAAETAVDEAAPTSQGAPSAKNGTDGDRDEAIEQLGDFLVERPDVIDALNDPAVRAYLANPENVKQMQGLAQMVASAEDDLKDADPTP